MIGDKRTLYRRASSTGSFLNGVEHVRIINGKLTVTVKLQDGAEALLSELVVTQIVERRKEERHPHLFFPSKQAPQSVSESCEPHGTDSLKDALQRLNELMRMYTVELSWNDGNGIAHNPKLEMRALDYPQAFYQLSLKIGEFSATFGASGVQLKVMQQQN